MNFPYWWCVHPQWSERFISPVAPDISSAGLQCCDSGVFAGVQFHAMPGFGGAIGGRFQFFFGCPDHPVILEYSEGPWCWALPYRTIFCQETSRLGEDVVIFHDLVAVRIQSTQPYGCFRPTMATRAWGDLVPLWASPLIPEKHRHPKLFTLPSILGSMVKCGFPRFNGTIFHHTVSFFCWMIGCPKSSAAIVTQWLGVPFSFWQMWIEHRMPPQFNSWSSFSHYCSLSHYIISPYIPIQWLVLWPMKVLKTNKRAT
jgi:hypothetical protein